MISHISTVAVYVQDQKAAKDFWQNKMGFEVRLNIPMGPSGNWLEVAPSGAQTCVVLFPKQMMPGWEEMKPSIVFQCDDVQKTYEELSAKGVRFIETPKKMPWGHYARFADNEGNEFILKQ
jgi:lactoylglutathione lyase